MSTAFKAIFLLAALSTYSRCHAQVNHDYLVLVTGSFEDIYGYKNQKGELTIPMGKYSICYTDTFRNYAMVLKPGIGMVAINRQEKVMYKVFPFDNGPDDASDGLFRIIEHGRIGYADAKNGRVVIAPQFACAWPFEKGMAKVSNACKTVREADGEHSSWQSTNWYYINKKGERIIASKPVNKRRKSTSR